MKLAFRMGLLASIAVAQITAAPFMPSLTLDGATSGAAFAKGENGGRAKNANPNNKGKAYAKGHYKGKAKGKALGHYKSLPPVVDEEEPTVDEPTVDDTPDETVDDSEI